MSRWIRRLVAIAVTCGMGCVALTQAMAGDLTTEELAAKREELTEQLQKLLAQQQQTNAAVEQVRGAIAILQQLEERTRPAPTAAVAEADP